MYIPVSSFNFVVIVVIQVFRQKKCDYTLKTNYLSKKITTKM